VKPDSLYLHIPFCAHLCSYCDFAKVLYEPSWVFPYLEELKKEVEAENIGQVSTIYIGGGTPSALSMAELTRLLAFVSPHLKIGGEFTFEANPENFTSEKAFLLRRYGVNRLSFGVESADPLLLKKMGRHHTFTEAEAAISLARAAGFSNINADLIYALPGENEEVLENDIKALLSLKTEHLSAYCLSVNPGTRFFNAGVHEMDQALQAEQYNRILQAFRKAGYDRYEVSNFAKSGHFSRHNLVYWKDEPYYAAGLGASGYIDTLRYTNTRSLSAYFKGKRHEEEEIVTPTEDRKYFFLTNLRLEKGFSLESYHERFGDSFEETYASEIAPLIKSGLLTLTKERVFATDQGILLLDRILVALY
jgi:putative oxygen-independent coproporphyrinogen III oxidase